MLVGLATTYQIYNVTMNASMTIVNNTIDKAAISGIVGLIINSSTNTI